MKLAGLLKDAFEKAGVALPEKPVAKKPQAKSTPNNKTHKSAKAKRPVAPKQAHRNKPSKNQFLGYTHPTADNTVQEQRQAQQALAAQLAPEEQDRIIAKDDARFTWQYSNDITNQLLTWPQSGIQTCLGRTADEKFLSLGLDFGTSTLKAVITDNERQLSYAVPFRNAPSVNRYLLPCSVYYSDNKYSQISDGLAYQDLKLSLLENPSDTALQSHVIAFLALALQSIRAWLLSEHGKTYSGVVIWDLAIGLPIAHSTDDAIAALFEKIATAAWISSTAEEISHSTVSSALARATQLHGGSAIESDNEDIEVRVQPEIAAQINGFVSSEAYDPNAKNIFLMVDIGAGTLDASIFRIERPKGKSKDKIILFKTTVEPHGVMNLHKKRMSWLASTLKSTSPDRTDLLEDVEKSKAITDSAARLPSNMQGYFEHVKIKCKGMGVDYDFYAQVKAQVASETYHQTLKDRLLSAGEMRMPMFLCGGGSRLEFYSRLNKYMHEWPGFSWFGVTPRKLQIPRGLQASGLKRNDYDRLSVAYGLSKLKLDRVIINIDPLPVEVVATDHAARFVDSSQL